MNTLLLTLVIAFLAAAATAGPLTCTLDALRPILGCLSPPGVNLATQSVRFYKTWENATRVTAHGAEIRSLGRVRAGYFRVFEFVLQDTSVRVQRLRAFAELPALEILHINSNRQLRHVRLERPTRSSFGRLRALRLGGNAIRRLTGSFAAFPLLSHIELGDNQLESFGPRDLPPRLRVLDLSRNRLLSFALRPPARFRSLPQLWSVRLQGNQLAEFDFAALAESGKRTPWSLVDLRENLPLLQNTSDWTGEAAASLYECMDDGVCWRDCRSLSCRLEAAIL